MRRVNKSGENLLAARLQDFLDIDSLWCYGGMKVEFDVNAEGLKKIN